MKKLALMFVAILALAACGAQGPTIITPTETVTATATVTPESVITPSAQPTTDLAHTNPEVWATVMKTIWDKQTPEDQANMCLAWNLSPTLVMDQVVKGVKSDGTITDEELAVGKPQIKKFFEDTCS